MWGTTITYQTVRYNGEDRHTHYLRHYCRFDDYIVTGPVRPPAVAPVRRWAAAWEIEEALGRLSSSELGHSREQG